MGPKAAPATPKAAPVTPKATPAAPVLTAAPKAEHHANFGDLSFLNSEKAFKAAAAARAKFIAAPLKLAAKSHHQPMKYYAARHHAGYRHTLMMKFASELKARISAHVKASATHESAKKNTHNAETKRA